MKFKRKISALTLALVLGAGALVGCKKKDPDPPVEDTYYVSVPTSSDYTISGIDSNGYKVNAPVSFTVRLDNTEKEITAVGYDSTTLTAKADGSYGFSMPEKDVRLFVSTRTVEHYKLSHSGEIRVGGDPVAFTLMLGTDAVPTWTLEAKSGAEFVTIDGHNVTGKAVGEAVLVAKVGGEEVDSETVSVLKSEVMTLAEAIDDAWTTVTDFNDNSKNTKTTDKYKVRAKIVFMGNVYNGKVEMLLDDGTAIIDYQVSSSSAITKVAVGDVIEINEPLSNYYGLFEMYSSKVDYITKLSGVTIDTTPFTDIADGAAYNTVYNNNIVNNGKHNIVPANLSAKGKVVGEKNRYEVPGAEHGLLATTKSVIDLEFEEGATYNFKGYLLNWNSSSSALYTNFIAIEQEALAAKSVTIDQDDFELKLNNSKQLTYTTDPVGAGKEVRWSSSNPDAVSVDENTGVVTAHAVTAEPVTITVTVDGKTDTVKVTVSAELTPATAVSLPATLTLDSGKTEQLTATVTPADTTDAAEWSSDAEAVATVDNTGKVTGVAAGTANITVTYNASVSATCVVTVNAREGSTPENPITAARAVEIGKALPGESSKSVYTEDKYYTKGIITGGTAASNKVSNGLIDDVLGLYNTKISEELQAKYEKGAEIIVYGEICNYSAGYKIQYAGQAEVYSITADKVTMIEVSGSTSVGVGATTTLTATALPASLGAAVTFESKDTSVATVSPAGVVTGVAAGSAIIEIKAGTVVKEVTVSVTSASATEVSKTIAQMSGTTTDGTKVPSMTLDEVITMSTNDDGNNSKVYGSGAEWRLYQTNNAVVTLTAAAGYKLVSVVFEFTVTNTGAFLFNEVAFASGELVALSGSTAQFKVGNSGSATNGQVRVTAVTVVYDAA